jgi:hypothetical protein
MSLALQIFEAVLTAPGRLIIWFEWALPGNWIHHDNASRDNRSLHWIASFGFYLFVGGLWWNLSQGGEGAIWWENIRIALGLSEAPPRT